MTKDGGRAAVLQLLAGYDSALRREFGDQHFKSGSCLLLGRHYGKSPVIYFSLNPGHPRNSPCDLSSTAPWNVPFFNRPELNRQYVYLHNCQRFFSSDPGLFRWINDAVTSAFLVPWRTQNMAELNKLNRMTNGRVFEYARTIARIIIDHHRAELVIAAGKAALQLIKALQLTDNSIERGEVQGAGGSYQWSKCRAFIGGRPLTILQIPHFSRAKSSIKLSALVPWLRTELEPFGCRSFILANDE